MRTYTYTGPALHRDNLAPHGKPGRYPRRAHLN
jgi:hypothetical protein